MTSYDAVVIGSGISGLAAACVLAESGRRVAVLEQHSVAGGLMQRFRRGGVLFDTGFHYVGGLGPGGPLRRYIEQLGVLGDISPVPYDDSGFDEVVLPGRRFRFPVGRRRVEDALAREFPAEAGRSAAFLAKLDSVLDGHPFYSFRQEDFAATAPAAVEETTVAEALGGIESPDLRAVLSAHTLLYGLPAARAPLAVHAPVTGALFHSAHGLAGGGPALADALLRRFRELGGVVHLRADAASIRIDDGRVAGVGTTSGAWFATESVVAAIHPAHVLRLVGDAAVPARVAQRIRGLRDGAGAFLVHGVVRAAAQPEPRRNWFWFPDAASAADGCRPWFETGGPPGGVVLLTGSAPRDEPGGATFHAYCLMRPGDVAAGDPGAWAARKAEAARGIARIVEECVPAWAGRHRIVDVSAPWSLERFVRSPAGACFGAECSADQWRVRRSLSQLGITGLRLAGQSVGVPGILGSLVTGVIAAGGIAGSLPRLYAELRARGVQG